MSLQNIPDNQKRIIRIAGLTSGLFFISASTFILISPDYASELLGSSAQLIAYIGLFVGIVDSILALFIFRSKEKK